MNPRPLRPLITILALFPSTLLFSACRPKKTEPAPVTSAPLPDPILKGKKTSEWVRLLRYATPREDVSTYEQALRSADLVACLQIVEGMRWNPGQPRVSDPQRLPRILGQIGQPAYSAVFEGLKSDNREIRYGCLVAIKLMGDEAALAVPRIAGILTDKDLDLVRLACDALVAIGPAAAVAEAEFVQVMRDPNLPCRPAVIVAAGRWRPITKPIAEALIEALDDERCREVATASIREAGGGMSAGLPLAKERVQMGKPEGLSSVYIAVGEEKATAQILLLMSDLHPKARRVAMSLIPEVYQGNKDIVKALEWALQDADAGVKAEAAKSLLKVAPDVAKRHGIE